MRLNLQINHAPDREEADDRGDPEAAEQREPAAAEDDRPLAGYLVAWAATFVGLASGVVGITLAARSATSVPEAARA